MVKKTKNFLMFLFLIVALKIKYYAKHSFLLELQYAIDTFYFLVMGALVMWMAAGFTMLESGMVTSKSVSSNLCKKYWFICNFGNYVLKCGYNLAYGIPEAGYIGTFTSFVAVKY